ncbi:TPA: hypothetical protein ACIN8P_002054 [Streptococcus agalactiae]|nr:hypothetical protein [Streptococcus agalactiae]
MLCIPMVMHKNYLNRKLII